MQGEAGDQMILVDSELLLLRGRYYVVIAMERVEIKNIRAGI